MSRSRQSAGKSSRHAKVEATALSGLLSEPIAAKELIAGAAPRGLTANANFVPSEKAGRASEPFSGTLLLESAPMTVTARNVDGQLKRDGFTSNPVLGKDTTLFPNVPLSFFTHHDHLVPTTENIVRSGSLGGTRSFWDILVQPGRVWSEPNDPPGWNRAAFPFALTQGAALGDSSETHHGLALFLYSGRQVTPVRFQLVQQTMPVFVTDFFTAWGVTAASFRPERVQGLEERQRKYEMELADRFPVKPWAALSKEVSLDPLVRAFVADPNSGREIVSAVVHQGVLYRTDCLTAAGPYPYSSEMRFGAMSVTKSAMTSIALLRVAEKFGTEFLDEPIAKFLPAARRPGWDDVTYRHLANMSSGHHFTGEGGKFADPHFNLWVRQRTMRDRTEVALSSYRRTYRPGGEFHYINQDTYLEGIALDALLRSKEGPEASAWEMLRREVYEPIGIHHLPSAATVEDDGSEGTPLWSAGYYPTLDDLAKLAMLIQNCGAYHGQQILHRGLVKSLLATTAEPLKNRSPDPEYYLNWWVRQVDSWWVPYMSGWGGNEVAVLPKDLITIKIGNHATAWPPFEGYPTLRPMPLGTQ